MKNLNYQTGRGGGVSSTHEWLTPPWILQELGNFDLDPCAPIKRPWDTAKKHFNIHDNGLFQEWTGRVWCNPPYGKHSEKWLAKCVNHGNCIALIFARTETKSFHKYVWDNAESVLFLKGRIKFFTVDGKEGKGNAGAPSVLISYNPYNSSILKNSNIPGKFIKIK